MEVEETIMDIKQRQTNFIIILIIIIIFGLFIFVYSLVNPNFNAITYLSGGSTFFIAILTIIYVLTTSKQLDVMTSQLNEMKHERELQNQPFPWITSIKMTLEKPDFYYYPPEDKYSTSIRTYVDFKLKNIGNFPSICIDVSSKIIIPKDKEPLHINTTSIRIDTIEEKQIYPFSKKEKDNFMFVKNQIQLLQSLTENNIKKFPRLSFCITYKNIMGGCFMALNEYLILQKTTNQKKIITNWLTKLTSFSIKYKEELEDLKEIKKSDRKNWEKLFNKTRKSFLTSITNKKGIELLIWAIPGAFIIKSISNEEYKEYTSKLYYSTIIPPVSLKRCMAKEDEE